MVDEPLEFGELPDSPSASIADALREASASGSAGEAVPTDDTVPGIEPLEPLAPLETPPPLEPLTAAEPSAETPPTEATEPTAEPDESGNRILLEAWRDLYESDYTDKYKNDYEFVRSRKELEKKLHERDAEAEYGRRVAQTYGDVFQQQPQQQQPQQPQEAPPSREQVQLWQQQVRKNPDTGEYEPVPGAEPGVVQKLQNAQDRMTQAIHAMAFTPDQFLQERLSPVIQGILNQANQQTAQTLAAQQALQQQQREAMGWVGQHAEWLCANGRDLSGGYSPIGGKFLETFDGMGLQKQVDTGSLTMGQAMNVALGYMQATQPKPKPVTPPRQQAVHVPNVAAPAAGAAVDPWIPLEGERPVETIARVIRLTGVTD